MIFPNSKQKNKKSEYFYLVKQNKMKRKREYFYLVKRNKQNETKKK